MSEQTKMEYPMTDAKLADIRAAIDAADQGGYPAPWHKDTIEGSHYVCFGPQNDPSECFDVFEDAREADAELTVLLRNNAKWLLSQLAAAQEQQAAQAAELLSLARAYDPNCDEYHYETQLAAMKAARQTVEAMQELATYLGRDPEGCLSDVPDEAMGKIEELEAELERVRGERDAAKQAATAWNALMNGIEAIRDAQTDPDFTPDQRLNAYIDVYTRLKQEKKDLEASLAAEREKVAALTRERDEALRQCREWAQKAGLAQGELAASEMAGNLREWKERAERAEGELAKMRPRAERITTAFVDYILKHSTLCPAGAYQLVDELTAQVLPTQPQPRRRASR